MNLGDFADLGDAVSGLCGVVLALAAIIGGSAGLGDWRARQRAEKELAKEQANEIRLNRQRVLQGWRPHGVHVYGVEVVDAPAAVAKAVEELSAGGPSDYVLLRVNETADGNANRAYSLRQLVQAQHYLAQAPSSGEYEALLKGRDRLAQDQR
ncbi:hypothetical protein ACIBSW_13845 [Actinoplanes sp. NPDC049668]|uniref:hypothetical protein n=1 Tax=unclassified Actinoplanes TaxID=2626549 RepID=UPI0033B9DA27